MPAAGHVPEMMEHLPASDDDAISASLRWWTGPTSIVGIFAHRYGYVPEGHAISVTEMEYNRAVERKIPRLIFVMDKDHPITIDHVELGEGADKLEEFKERLQTDNIVNFFKSPADLRGLVINSLSQRSRTRPHRVPLHQRHPRGARGVHRAPVHPPADAPAGRPAGGAQSADRLGGGQTLGVRKPQGSPSSTSSRSAGWARAR